MIIRDDSGDELVLIRQTDHSQLVGKFAAHWGNENFARPEPYESVVRAAVYHDYGYLRFETSPCLDTEKGTPYEFRTLPYEPKQFESYQWCIDWLSDIDPYSGLLVSMHRTGLWKGRYEKIAHPAGRYNPQGLRSEIVEFVERHEAKQQEQQESVDKQGLWTNYQLLQVWDLLSGALRRAH
ncbi:MAG TPA: DUF3891 family protein [Dehalococcoidia bacterium]|nr:DUF3891 family protein [Dehalococcoidia bacterium]